MSNEERKEQEETQLEAQDQENATPTETPEEAPIAESTVEEAQSVAESSTLATSVETEVVETEEVPVDVEDGFSDEFIYHVDGINNCPFRLAQSRQCTVLRGTVGDTLTECIPLAQKNIPPDVCPIILSDYLVSLIVQDTDIEHPES